MIFQQYCITLHFLATGTDSYHSLDDMKQSGCQFETLGQFK